MKRAKYIFCVGVIFLIASCTDLLDTAPNDGTVSDASYFKTTSDFDSFMFGTYADLAGSFDRTGVANWIKVTGFISQEIVGPDEIGKVLPQYMSSSNDQITQFWNSFFDIIGKTNLILSKLPLADLPAADATRLEGEALFFRGFAYSYIARAYGNAPLLLAPYDVSQTKVECTPEAQIWDQVITDLTAAAAKLPEEWDAINVGRATKGSAYAYLANAYMYKKDWPNAETAANSLIALGKYSLLPTVREVFSALTPNNVETIFEVQFRDIIDGKINWNNFSEAGQCLDEYTAPRNIGSDWAPAAGWGEMVGSRKLADSFEPGDDRRTQLIKVPGEKYKGETMADTLLIPLDVSQPNSSFSTKWWRGPQTNINVSYLHGQNVQMMRYAEFLLDYSEILFMQGKTAQAYEQMNIVRRRAKLLDLPESADQTTFMTSLMKERRAELNFEPNLWFHYTRTGTAANFLLTEYNITMDQKWNKFPVPQLDRDQNPKLCQNSGY